jgi:branched-chain amino acid transport system permease protein
MELDKHSGAVLVDNADRLALKGASRIAARAGLGAGDALRSAAMIAVVAGLPLVMPINIATEVLIFGIFAMATNLLIGTAGLYSFGQAAFFGTGGYVAGYLSARGWVSLPVALLLASAAGALLAALIGVLSIRRAGIYFMMLTFAFNQLVFYVIYSWQSVTGGEDGRAGIRRLPLKLPLLGTLNFDDNRTFYALAAILFLASMAILVRIVNSPFGLVLAAARQNARRTTSLGYSVHALQLAAFVIAGAVSGVAGALFGMLYRIMPIDSVHWLGSAYVVFMVLIGGQGNMLGPAIGAAIFIWLQGLFSLVWTRWPLLLGLFVVLVMIYLPGGLLDLFTRGSAWISGRRRQR